MIYDALRATVEIILRRSWQEPKIGDWSVQGLGMMRYYLGPTHRLHVWSPDLVVPNVSTIHTHPWDFESLVLAGSIRNDVYGVNRTGVGAWRQTLRCGTDGGLVGEPERIGLNLASRRVYIAGETYHQRAEEIHASHPSPGTVTLIARRFHLDTEHADVFWPVGASWVSAEPRPATPEEVRRVLGPVMKQWEPTGGAGR